MRRNMMRALGVGVAAVLASAIPGAPSQAAQVTVNWATIAGFYTDVAQKLADKFESQTGIKVNIISIDLAQLYEKEVIEAVGQTGAYDVETHHTLGKPEFVNAGWLRPIGD